MKLDIEAIRANIAASRTVGVASAQPVSEAEVRADERARIARELLAWADHRTGYEWVSGSLWDAIARRMIDHIDHINRSK